jgi:hypothetical protein
MRGKASKRHKLINKEMDITTHSNEIQSIIRESFENICSNKPENVKEMDKFLDA